MRAAVLGFYMLLAPTVALGQAGGNASEAVAATSGVQVQSTVTPAVIKDGLAPVTPSNTRRDPMTGAIDVFLLPEPGREDLPVIDPNNTRPEAGLLRRIDAAGNAAGLSQVLYDNRDRGHSDLQEMAFPQVSRTRYDEAFTSRMQHNGVAGQFMFSLPTIGNSSTALTRTPIARSLGRLALGDQASALRSYRLYASNQMYVYPEHRDYDADTGDRLFASAPYFMLSQGSSYRDQPFVEALLLTTAALQPATFDRLVDLKLLAPTLQMILRRTLAGVRNDTDYVSPRAHPPVFHSNQLRQGAAVGFANSITPDTIPPMVQISMVSDFKARPAVDYLPGNIGEVLFTTPSAVARAWRSFDHTRRITVSAAKTEDPNNRPLRFHWAVLQGDPEKIQITPQDESGTVADIDIKWHDRFALSSTNPMTSPRVDIAVFADNGAHISAPAMISILFPTFQERDYRPNPEGELELHSLGYAPTRPEDPYADPLIWPVEDWRDQIRRNQEGEIVSITRTWTKTGRIQELQRVPLGWLTTDEQGRPVTQQFLAAQGSKGALSLEARVIGSVSDQ